MQKFRHYIQESMIQKNLFDPKTDTQQRAFDRCYQTALEYSKKIGGTVVQVSDYKGDLSKAHPKWKKDFRDFPDSISHYMNLHNDKFIDWTARQFNPSHPYPRIMTESQVRREWSNIYK